MLSIECETTNHCGRRRRQRRRWKSTEYKQRSLFRNWKRGRFHKKRTQGLDSIVGRHKNNNFPHWRGCGDDTRAPRLRLSSHFLLSR